MADGRKIGFEQTADRLVLKGLPEKSPDKIAGVTVVKMEFADVPYQMLGAGCVVLGSGSPPSIIYARPARGVSGL